MALSIALPRSHAPGLSALRLPRPSEAAVVFVLTASLYLAVAYALVFSGNALSGDGVSRVAIANRILFSRDPHLAAVGFVWSPLPNLVLLPLVPFKFLWPALVQQAFAGNIVSSLFMAGAVWQLLGLLQEIGVKRAMRLALTVCFALHPMIVLYGANSMSEAQFIFFLLLVVRYLMRWVRTNESGPLVVTGLGLGLAYLTRYEAVAAAVAVIPIVAIASYMRNIGNRAGRLTLAVCDCLIACTPIAAAFVLWAFASWLITGVPFQQFSSVYGNAAQLEAKGLVHPGIGQEILWARQGMIWMLALEPLVAAVAVVCVIRSLSRRDGSSLAPAFVLSAVLAFMYWAYSTGMILRSLRYFIVVIPLAVVMVGMAVAPPRNPISSVRPAPHHRRFRRSARARSARRATVAVVCLLALAAAVPAGAIAVLSPSINQSDSDAYMLQAFLNRGSLTAEQQLAAKRWTTDRAVAGYIDSMHPGRGSVLVDDFLGFVIVMASEHPDQFVITSDRDFQAILADPAQAGVLYVLVPPDRDLGSLDAVNRAFPHIYDNGAGIATLANQFDDASDLGRNWRLYRLTPQH
jgi:hypothetical protein